jgi:hypothetical protein
VDSVENKIETTYERKISSTERCETPMEVPGAAMATAKAAYVASNADFFFLRQGQALFSPLSRSLSHGGCCLRAQALVSPKRGKMMTPPGAVPRMPSWGGERKSYRKPLFGRN